MPELTIPAADGIEGVRHLHSGKVRDLYAIEEGPYAGQLLMVASDRISAFDHVLEPGHPRQGRDPHPDVAVVVRPARRPGRRTTSSRPTSPTRCAAARSSASGSTMFPVECVARGYLTGTGLLDYRATGPEVCGIALPGRARGRQPAAGADLHPGHQGRPRRARRERLLRRRRRRPSAPTSPTQLRELTLAVYARAEGIARERGIILADTKFELGARADGTIVLADEVLTPDSSRFWPADEWQPGRPQPSYDKQIVRNWLLSAESGWDKAADAPPPALPPEVVDRTRQRYVEAYELLTGSGSDLARAARRTRRASRCRRRPPSTTSSTRTTGPSGSPRCVGSRTSTASRGVGQTWTDVTKPGLRPAMRTDVLERPRLWSESGHLALRPRRPDAALRPGRRRTRATSLRVPHPRARSARAGRRAPSRSRRRRRPQARGRILAAEGRPVTTIG